MKSRVINSRNFDFNFQDRLFTGYTSKLKPSLFYGNKKIEGYIWLQSQWTNKMSKWQLDKEEKEDNKILSWTYIPCDKTIERFPKLEGYKLVVNFDSREIKKMAYKKYRRISEEHPNYNDK